MTAAEKLFREIEELKEAIQIDWDYLSSNVHREEERERVRNHLDRCEVELKKLRERYSACTDRPS
jgi:hypothetical protein